MNDTEHIRSRIVAFKGQLDALPASFEEIKDTYDRAIDDAIREAGAMPKVRTLRANLEAQRVGLQTKADKLMGGIEALEAVILEMEKAEPPPRPEIPLPDGVTHMHGIDLRPLEFETRLMVMGGNRDTIEALNGTFEEDDGDDEEDDREEDGGNGLGEAPDPNWDPSFDHELDDPNLSAIRNLMAQES